MRQFLCSPDKFSLSRSLQKHWSVFICPNVWLFTHLGEGKRKNLRQPKHSNELITASNIYSIFTQLWGARLSYFIFYNVFSLHVNNPLTMTYSSFFNMTHDSLSTLLLKPAARKDFNNIKVPDFCGLVLHLLLRALCQWCTWADTDNSLMYVKEIVF